MKRREFLRTGSVVGGAAVFGAHAFPHHLYAAAKEKTAQDVVTLGKTGIKVSRLFQGTGTNGVGKSSNQIRGLGFDGVVELLRAGVDQGVTTWDLADQYGTHPHANGALKTVARDKVVIMTKTHASTEKEMWADLDRFRKEIGTDMLDIVLLHCMMSADWPKEKAGAMAVLSEAKAKGIIRAHGVSCHDFGALKAAAASDWVEVDLARLNPAGVIMDAPVEEVLPVLADMKRKGKGIIGMKILGAGRLRDRVDDALQYALASPVLDCFTIGAENRAAARGPPDPDPEGQRSAGDAPSRLRRRGRGVARDLAVPFLSSFRSVPWRAPTRAGTASRSTASPVVPTRADSSSATIVATLPRLSARLTRGGRPVRTASARSSISSR